MFFWSCPICKRETLWAFVMKVVTRGRYTGYSKYRCSGCEKLERMK